MLPLLVGPLSPETAVLVAPLFFGVAHLHHAVERVRKGQAVAAAVAVSLFQMVYTTLFGAYSAFLFLRTGHLAAPVLTHSLCNFMGFPDVGEIFRRPTTGERAGLAAAYVMGAVSFALMLFPLTDPDMYGNDIYNVGE
jgi:prenyl protein peptidase